MTMHLIKIQVYTHGSRVTDFSDKDKKSLEFRLIQPDDKALGAFPWI